MINLGAWVLLSSIFGGLVLLVQRTERKRRNISLIILAFVGITVWQYALYRISGDCDQAFQIACRAAQFGQRFRAIAVNTVNLSILTALLLNLAYWVVFGRSNPPASSDAIQVFGMND